MANEQIIGYAVVSEAFNYSVPQEFAGAVETVRVEASRYPILQCRGQYGGSIYHGIRFEGVTTYRGWFGTNTRVEHPNTPASPFAQYYDYQIAMAALGMRELCIGRVDGRPLYAAVELAEGVTAERLADNFAKLRTAA